MFLSLLLGSFTVFLTMSIQIYAVVAILRYLIERISDSNKEASKSYWFDTYALSVVLLILFVGHLIQIAIWAQLFVWVGEFQHFSIAFYHSAVNFASLGYGDIVMSEKWRLMGALEASNGVLMFGLSAAAMYSIMQRVFARYRPPKYHQKNHEDAG